MAICAIFSPFLRKIQIKIVILPNKKSKNYNSKVYGNRTYKEINDCL